MPLGEASPGPRLVAGELAVDLFPVRSMVAERGAELRLREPVVRLAETGEATTDIPEG